MLKILLLGLFSLLTSLPGVSAKEVYVKAGDLVALKCPCRGSNCVGAKSIWTSYTTQKMDLTNMSSVEQMGMLIHGRSLVIRTASVNYQGNYSCSLRNVSRLSWFSLMVYTTVQEENMYPQTCVAHEACTLSCPNENLPDKSLLNITSRDIIWHKEGESSLKSSYFSRVKENDHGVYACTRSYLYHGQIYNMTFTVMVNVNPKSIPNKSARITSPRPSDVFYVDLGSPKVIDCEALLYSNKEEVMWLIGTSFVDTNVSASVYYNFTRQPIENDTEGIKMTASLVFKKVSEEDLSKNYTCKLESDKEAYQQHVNITLAQNSKPSYKALVRGIVSIVIVMVVTVVIYVKFKIDVTLFLRDTLGLHSSTSDGKSYDAFLMSYKSDTNAGLNKDDRNQLESVLEETFGYSLCLFDRDVLPGESVAEAVLDCIEQSRTLVLVPTSPDPGPESGLLSAIHEALVERQTRLVFIKTEATDVSLPEALQLLGKAGDCVTWKGQSSRPLSSSFWKQLRYHLPAPQCTPKITLLPQTV